MADTFSVAATKNRGRPRKYAYYESHIGYAERAGRNLQNWINASDLVTLLYDLKEETGDESYSLLAWEFENSGYEGDSQVPRYRYQGIAEQIGRMYNGGRIDAQKAVDLTKWALRQIQVEGRTSRDVEKELRQYHKSLRLSVAATENKEA